MSLVCLSLFWVIAQQPDPKLLQMIKRIDEPDAPPRAKVAAYGDRAFQLLYPMAKGRLEIYTKASRAKGVAPEALSRAKWKLITAVQYLADCAKPNRTSEMTDLFKRSDESIRPSLLYWLTTTGSLKQNETLFKDLVLKASKRLNAENETLAVEALVRNDERGAVEFLVPLLLKTDANPIIRSSIVLNIGKTRSPKALAAIVRSRRGERTYKPVIHHESLKVFATTKDRAGTEWGLIRWNALGAPDDLWVARRSNGQWVDRVFTGLNSRWPSALPSGR
jgi:hypothetical protein